MRNTLPQLPPELECIRDLDFTKLEDFNKIKKYPKEILLDCSGRAFYLMAYLSCIRSYGFAPSFCKKDFINNIDQTSNLVNWETNRLGHGLDYFFPSLCRFLANDEKKEMRWDDFCIQGGMEYRYSQRQRLISESKTDQLKQIPSRIILAGFLEMVYGFLALQRRRITPVHSLPEILLINARDRAPEVVQSSHSCQRALDYWERLSIFDRDLERIALTYMHNWLQGLCSDNLMFTEEERENVKGVILSKNPFESYDLKNIKMYSLEQRRKRIIVSSDSPLFKFSEEGYLPILWDKAYYCDFGSPSEIVEEFDKQSNLVNIETTLFIDKLNSFQPILDFCKRELGITS